MSKISKHTEEQKQKALAMAEAATIREASEETGVPAGTIKRWRYEQRQAKLKKRTVKEVNQNQINEPVKTGEKEGKNPGGRPTKYRDKYNEQAYKLCLLGATDDDLASFFEIEESTVNNWKLKYPKFLESIKKGKDAADARVADRLYQRAMGYETSEDKIFHYKGQPVVVPTTTKYPPDTTAAIFWLCNRQKQKWQHVSKVAMELTGKDGGPVEFEQINEKQARREILGRLDSLAGQDGRLDGNGKVGTVNRNSGNGQT